MGKQRTGGMTTIGVLNIIFGALGGVVFLLMILGAGFMTAAGSAMGGEEGTAVATGGGFLMLIGIAAFAINLMLFISGIGVLKMASWGRTLCIAYGALGIIVYGASLGGGDFSIPTLASLAYCVLLIGLFFTPGWKAAFGTPSTTTETTPATETAHDDENREAA